MPWDLIPLNDGLCCHIRHLGSHLLCTSLGNAIPSIAFGTWTLGNGQGPIDQVEQAFSVGFNHIGTFILSNASIFRNRATD